MAGPPALDEDRRVRRQDVGALGRGSGRPAQPSPRCAHRLPHPARPRRRHVAVGGDPGQRPRRHGRPPCRGGARGRPGQADVLDPARQPHARRSPDPPRRSGRAAGPDRVPQAQPRERGPLRRRPQATPALPPSPRRSHLRPGQRRREGRRRELATSVADRAVRDPPGRRPGSQRRHGGERRTQRAGRHTRHRCHRHRARRRWRRGPAAVQQRGAPSRSGGRPHPGGERDRARRRLTPARPRRRPPRLHADRRGQGDRPRRRPRAPGRSRQLAREDGGPSRGGCTTSGGGSSSCGHGRCSRTPQPSCVCSARS